MVVVVLAEESAFVEDAFKHSTPPPPPPPPTDMFESEGDFRSIDLSEPAPFNAILNPKRFDAAVG